MSNYSIPLSFQSLIQFVYDKKYPTKREIIEHLSNRDQSISERTLERYFSRIRVDLGLEIAYDHQYKGYYINEEESVKVASFFKFLEIVQVADIFSNGLKDSNTILEYVSFDDSKNLKGIDNLKILLLAIKEHREISFLHENYENNSQKVYQCTPLLLKEYLNRWYVICGINNRKIRTFGIDRISAIEMQQPSQKLRSDYSEMLAKFEHTVGLTYGEGEPEKVSLLVDALHVKYMRSLPLHHSQFIHPVNTDNRHQVDFFIYPNYEFITQVLKIGEEAEVIHPPSFRAKIKLMLEEMVGKYK